MNRKGQVSIFIFLGIIIIVVIIIFFFVRDWGSENISKEFVGNSDVKIIHSFVRNCLERITTDGVYYIGETGGYYIPPRLSSEEGVAYYYVEGKSYLPPIENIGRGISFYIETSLNDCIIDFSSFSNYKIEIGDINALTNIEEKEVIIEIDYQLNIEKGEKSYDLREFEVSVPIRIGLMYNISDQIIQNLIENDGNNCLSCIDDLAQDNGIEVNLFERDDNSTLYILTDLQNNVARDAFEYYFVVK